MKNISKKQYQNAVKTVLAGGNSKLISTYEVKPFSWSISKKFKTLCGSVPENSKFLRNDKRGGKESNVYLVCTLANGYEICLTKKEQNKINSIEEAKKKAKKEKSQKIASELKQIAMKNGFKTVTDLKFAQIEINIFNRQRFDLAIKKRIETFENENGAKFQEYLLSDRVKISRIPLVFDCEEKQDLF